MRVGLDVGFAVGLIVGSALGARLEKPWAQDAVAVRVPASD